MTIPKKVREAIHLSAGDVVAVDVEGDRVSLRKVTSGDDYVRAVHATLTEWTDPEDEEAWRDL
ncbi:MAG: hypothetical protein A3G18_00305 [Rhodospirillales bacterium RIFCSPLOWO2_12_FULL_58_28]|nr:MAG: hypothetical protein A3H92_02915 [Rhodospirillales bacterium RIFCSPLOWO2_02_FULL_58_16]OHC79909.1 MAG: hypothetical protein A3G18_00305 [Rhodospirillales bacterium RIFCSPLOWO2_12_FULL_58_28]